jgi:hypothetical protein
MTIIFNESAFKHGFTAEDINCAMAVPLTDILLEKHINKYKELYKYLPRML